MLSCHTFSEGECLTSTAQLYLENFATLEESGFTGFVSVAELQRTSCRAVSSEPGVYLVLAEPTKTLVFPAESIGGHFRGRNPTAPIATLQSQWSEVCAFFMSVRLEVKVKRLPYGAG